MGIDVITTPRIRLTRRVNEMQVSPTLAVMNRALELKAREIRGKNIEACCETLRGLEGTAGRLYWQGVKTIVENKAEFAGRNAAYYKK